MTAQEFLIEKVIPIIESQRKEFEPKLSRSTSFYTWNEFIEEVKSDPDVLDWVMTEFFTGTCGKKFVVPEFDTQIETWYENDETEYFVVINVSGKFIMTKYSERKNFIWSKIEFFFVEQVEAMVPKLIWQKVQ